MPETTATTEPPRHQSGGLAVAVAKNRKRDGLVPIGEAFDSLGGQVQALRAAPPPPQRGFTLADQVNQLVSASAP